MKNHLPNLDSLRAIAAATVVIYHIDLALVMNGYKPAQLAFFPFNFGSHAVVFFFVLSGFLITHLLLKEKDKGPVSIKGFYLKRVLRIWPLYFLIVAASFLYFNHQPLFAWHGLTDAVTIGKHFPINMALLLAICPNVLLLRTVSLGYATPTWSIGVEEQFYLIWPWVIRSKTPLKYILGIILGGYLLNQGIIDQGMAKAEAAHWLTAGSPVYQSLKSLSHFFTFVFSFRVDAMAIGALGAMAVHRKSEILLTLFSRSFQWFTYFILALLFLFPDAVPYQFHSVVFMLIILNMAINPRSIFNVGNRYTDYLGKISYGLYLYHGLTIMPCIYLVYRVWKLPVTIASELVVCLLCLSASIAVAAVSYHSFEQAFLKLRSRRFFRRSEKLQVRLAAE